MSLEKHVTADFPKTFMWHTYNDEVVPLENSLLMAMALRQAGVSLEYHLYEDGIHGLSLAKPHTDSVNCDMIKPEVQSWIDLAEVWLNNL